MIKTSVLLFITVFVGITNLSAEEKKDSTSQSIILRKTEDLISTVFKPMPELNNGDSIVKEFDARPFFGIYKNNYIVTGTSIDKSITRYNSDAKFQISFRQRLTNSVLPFRSYLFLSYTQLAFWDIYKKSFPFGDINFNPTIGIGKVLIHNNRFIGMTSFQLEHESNGRSEEESRSWNRISLNAILKLDQHWVIQPKIWIPFVDGEHNRDLVKYKGWGFVAVDYSKGEKYNVGLIVTKRGGLNLNANIVVNFAYKLFQKDNQYLFLEYYNGYGESLLDYNVYRHRIRIGFVIKPTFMHAY